MIIRANWNGVGEINWKKEGGGGVLGTGDDVVGDLPRVRLMIINIKKAW